MWCDPQSLLPIRAINENENDLVSHVFHRSHKFSNRLTFSIFKRRRYEEEHKTCFLQELINPQNSSVMCGHESNRNGTKFEFYLKHFLVLFSFCFCSSKKCYKNPKYHLHVFPGKLSISFDEYPWSFLTPWDLETVTETSGWDWIYVSIIFLQSLGWGKIVIWRWWRWWSIILAVTVVVSIGAAWWIKIMDFC